MARDKLITIRVEQEFRDKLNLWAKANDVEISGLGYEIFKNLVEGKLKLRQVLNPIDEEKLSELEEKLTSLSYEQLDREEVKKLVDESIDMKIDSRLPNLEKLEKAIALVDEYEALLGK